MTLCFQCCSAATKLEKSGGLYALCVLFFFFNIHLVINLTVKEFEIQATKMENLDNSKEAGAGIKSGAAIILRSCLPFFRGKGERHLQ